jgi:hypothetical protein
VGDLAGPVGAGLQQVVELLRVVEEFQRALADGGEGLDDDLAEVLLEVAVALALVLRFYPGDGEAGEPGVDV